MAGIPIERPFWLDTVDRSPLPSVPLPKDADVVIVGAGFTGLSAARLLAKRGLHPLVVEAQHAGWGASSRNGGMALTGLKRPVEWLVTRFGLPHARRLFDMSLDAVSCVERIVEEEHIDCDFARCGHVEVACKASHLQHLRKTAETLHARFDHDVHILEADDVRARAVASPRYYGGLVDDKSAGLNPARYAWGLARAALARGAQIAENVEVQDVSRGAKGFEVTTDRGVVRAGAVLVATGAYTGAATPIVQRSILRIGSYVIATEPLGADAQALIPGGRMVFDTNNFLHYYRLTADGRLVFGGRAAFAPPDQHTVRESAAILQRGMVGVFPQLRDAAVAYAWGGSIDVTFDVLPHTGVIDGLHYAVGYAGHGVSMATYAGERMADVIAGDASGSDPLECGPLPPPPPGLSGASPWFLPIAGAWYRLLDWAS